MLIWAKKWNIIKHKNSLSHENTGKEISTFGDIEIKKKITAIRFLFFKGCRYWESIIILVTCIMILKLSHYI